MNQWSPADPRRNLSATAPTESCESNPSWFQKNSNQLLQAVHDMYCPSIQMRGDDASTKQTSTKKPKKNRQGTIHVVHVRHESTTNAIDCNSFCLL